MNSLEKFKMRMSMGGSNTTERIINRSRRVVEDRFSTSPSYYVIDVDGVEVESIVNRTNDYNIKLVYFKYDYDIKIGSLVTFEENKYILMEKDNDVLNSFAKMEKCNSTIKIQVGEPERVLVGADDRGRPVYEHIINYKDEPCIVRDKYYSSNENTQLPLPEGKIDIFLKYQETPNIAINQELELQEKTYKIADISYIDVVNDVGIMRIYAERREDE